MKKNKIPKVDETNTNDVVSEESVVITKVSKKDLKKEKKIAKKASKEQAEQDKLHEELEKLAGSAEELFASPEKRRAWVDKYFKKQFGKVNPIFMNLMQLDYAKVIEHAKILVGITDESYEEYHHVIAPDSLDNSTKVRYRFDKTISKDYTLYFDQVFMTVLFFGTDTLYIYRANVNHITGEIVMETANEFSYFDIVSVETRRRTDRVIEPKYMRLDLNLNLSDGEEFNLNLRNQKLYASQGQNYIFLILSAIIAVVALLVLGILLNMWMIGVYCLGLILVGGIIEIFRHKHKLHIECPYMTPNEKLIINRVKEKVRESRKL